MPPSAGPLMVAICHAAVDMAVAFCILPSGAAAGSSADTAGLSNAVAIPNSPKARKICVSVSHPPRVPQARNAAAIACTS
jgi:hypothetical protein